MNGSKNDKQGVPLNKNETIIVAFDSQTLKVK